MKILLVNPPNIDEERLDAEVIPLGLLYLESNLKSIPGLSVQIVNLFGINTWDEVAKVLQTYEYDVIGLSCYTRQRKSVEHSVRISKRVYPNAKVVIGGPHASFLDVAFMNNIEQVDYIVRGEGEYIFSALINAINMNTPDMIPQIAGLTYRLNGKIVRTPDAPYIQNLNDLTPPIQTQKLLDNNEMCRALTFHFSDVNISHGGKIAPILTSRGCDWNCMFCCNSSYWGRQRFRSPYSVYSEIKLLHNRYNVKLLDFYDDNLTGNTDHLLELCHYIVINKVPVRWWCSSRVDGVTSGLCRAMANAGCFMISFGVESGSQLILNTIGKGITPYKIKYAIKLCRKAGMSHRVTLSIGHPGESDQTISETLDLLRELKPNQVGLFLVKVYPGTPLYKNAKEIGLVSDDWWFDPDNIGVPYYTEEHSIKELLSYQQRIVDGLHDNIKERFVSDAHNIELILSW